MADPWLPIAESGIGFTSDFPDGVNMAGSVITAVRSGLPEDQSWSLQLAKAVPVRLRFTEFDSNGYGQSGYVMFNGQIVENTGDADEWAPNPAQSPIPSSVVVYVPGEQSDYPMDSYTVVVEVSPMAVCEELGRATRNYVSGYNRDRVFSTRLYANERRCLVTAFNGAIPPGRTIVRAVWQTFDTIFAAMSDPSIDGREVRVMISAQFSGRTRIRVDVTLDNGEIYSAWHAIRVMSAPYFNNQGWVTGPQRLVVTAP